MPEQGIAIGALARRSGCRIETIRYYERIGLLPAPARQGRFRRYAGADAARLAFIRRARELGFTLDQVRALLRLAGADAAGEGAGGPAACADARELAAEHVAGVRARIAALRRMETVLAETLRRCDAGKAPECPLIAALAGRPPP